MRTATGRPVASASAAPRGVPAQPGIVPVAETMAPEAGSTTPALATPIPSMPGLSATRRWASSVTRRATPGPPSQAEVGTAPRWEALRRRARTRTRPHATFVPPMSRASSWRSAGRLASSSSSHGPRAGGAPPLASITASSCVPGARGGTAPAPTSPTGQQPRTPEHWGGPLVVSAVQGGKRAGHLIRVAHALELAGTGFERRHLALTPSSCRPVAAMGLKSATLFGL